MFGQQNKGNKQICRVAYGKWGYDHEQGKSQLSLTPAFYSASNSYTLEAAYRIDDVWSVYGAVDLVDTSLNHFGGVGSVTLGDQKVNVDAAYNPRADHLIAKASTKIEDVALTAHVSLPAFKASPFETHKEKIEAAVSVSADDKVELSYDIQAAQAYVRYDRVLDYKSTARIEYGLKDQKDHSVALKLTHKADKDNTFTADVDITGKKYALKWASNADNGKWTIKTAIPFDKSPKDGTLTIKRRFDLEL
ncbi:hypothetical protein FVE85_7914 [Porphyridium purpureum]|uniref:Uncharacterized protein n=1 Tax=Porphyridium purpureum TaxID=35688 RepID=A0A5J4YPS0_PORPP|nr:hypothetical protein FVE85_7914 [Porphyridium purpureum]|eukprot:POR5371..scf295_9